MRQSGAQRAATIGALMWYSGVVVALTMLRAFYTIGDLWDPAKQMRRSPELVPFDTLMNATSWLKPVYE